MGELLRAGETAHWVGHLELPSPVCVDSYTCGHACTCPHTGIPPTPAHLEGDRHLGHTFYVTCGLGDHGIGFSGPSAPESQFSSAGVASIAARYSVTMLHRYCFFFFFFFNVCTTRVELVSTCSLTAGNSCRAVTNLWVGVNSREKTLVFMSKQTAGTSGRYGGWWRGKQEWGYHWKCKGMK